MHENPRKWYYALPHSSKEPIMSTEPQPWHRLHRSSWLVLGLAMIVWLVLMVPGEIVTWGITRSFWEQSTRAPIEIEHGWPAAYLTRECSARPLMQYQDNLSGPPWLNGLDIALRLGKRKWHFSSLCIDLVVGPGLIALPTVLWERRKRRRRFLQFSVRELLVATTCVAVGLGWFILQRRQIDRELLALDNLYRLNVRHQWPTVGRSPIWLGKLIGHGAREALLGRYSWTHVDRLFLSCPENDLNQERAKLLESFSRLRELDIHNERSSDDAIASVGRLKRLRRLFIRQPVIGDQGFAHLGKLVHLEELTLMRDATLTDGGAEHLSGLTKLRKLVVPESKIGARGADALLALESLEKLWLGKSTLDDTGLLKFVALPKLRALEISNSAVSDGAIAEFRRRRPDIELYAVRSAAGSGGG
jgi:hypothetical protein